MVEQVWAVRTIDIDQDAQPKRPVNPLGLLVHITERVIFALAQRKSNYKKQSLNWLAPRICLARQRNRNDDMPQEIK